MKLIVTGATGLVGTEVVRQALSIPEITSIVTLTRRPFSNPPNLASSADTSKLQSVVIEDFSSYSEAAQKELAGAAACIWLVAITPSKSTNVPWDEVRKVCLDHTVTGLETLAKLHENGTAPKPLRFIYTSGSNAERDQTKTPPALPEMCLLRGEVENRVLAFAAEHPRTIEACITKPGMINGPNRGELIRITREALKLKGIELPEVQLSEIAATLLKQAVRGIEKETLLNDDLVQIGQQALTG